MQDKGIFANLYKNKFEHLLYYQLLTHAVIFTSPSLSAIFLTALMSVWESWTPYSSHSVLYSSMEIVPSPLRSNFSNTFSNAVINTRGWFATFIISSTGWTQAATFVFYLQLLNLAHGVVSSPASHYCGSAVVECWYFLSIYPLLCSDHSGSWAVNEISSVFTMSIFGGGLLHLRI